ncbi:MAG: methyltransferase domain-containing protein [Ruminococcus sp.]|nr:methyltransferase domain-containing protein [Ruminococcus sp.]
MSKMIWQCPVCGLPLIAEGRSLHCENRHAFDRARSGYVHLLPSSRQHAKLPGDNPEMVRARRNFLQKGYYSHLLDTIAKAAADVFPREGVLLDAGCGEGYYTNGAASRLIDVGLSPSVYGVDISKTAADLAARFDKASDYAVGSVFHLPVQDESCDVVMSIFAPYCGEEFLRVLKPGGTFIMAIPAARHLWQLKAAVYENPYENAVKDYALEGFTFIKKHTAEREIFLDQPQDIADLFSMTPYAYRTGQAERERLASMQQLTTETAFEVLVYRKP